MTLLPTSIQTGQRAEQAAAEHLVRHGFSIIETNYRRPSCEIDIVARRGTTIYFVEVKYRATGRFGDGLEYIGRQKLKHMQRAAEVWVAAHGWQGEYTLSAIEVGGPDFDVDEFIESIWL